MSFVRAPNPIWYLPDLTGNPLNDEYFAFFLTNTLPYLPQNVYRDNQGMAVWTNDVVQFLPNGTLPDNLYFDPNLVYRIEIRHGDSQADPLIYEVNDFVPDNSSSIIVDDLSILFAENQISNGNFSQVNFTSTLSSSEPVLTITSAETYDIAPGWQLVLTGAGTTTLTQRIYSGSGVMGQTASPNYALEIANAGWATAILRQRFKNNGAIFGGGAVSMSALMRGVSGSVTVSMVYFPSNLPGNSTTVVQPTVVGTGSYVIVTGTTNLKDSNNSDLSTSAYVDMVINLPTTGSLDITDVQFVGQTDPIPGFAAEAPISTVVPALQQETEERNIDHLFHYYANDLILKPKKSLLAGWNFPLNPYQFITTTITTLVAQTAYVADQTIVHQEAASQVQTGKNVVGQRGNFVVKAVTAATTTRFALIQYIDSKTIAPYWSYLLSSLARARIVTTHNTQVRLKARLIYRATLPSTIGNTEPISAWPANSDPTFSAGWTALSPLNDPAYVLPNAYDTDSTTNAYPGFAFDAFQLPDSTAAAMTLGIVIYTMDNLDSTAASEDYIEFDQISLVPGQFASDALPQTFNESLADCQYYYRKSYPQGVLPGTAPNFSGASTTISTTTYGAGVSIYTERFPAMRATPSTAATYSPQSGTIAKLYEVTAAADKDTATVNLGDDGFMVQTATGIANANDTLQWQYIADARLGV